MQAGQGAGCAAASIRRASAIRRKQANDQNSINIQPITETAILAGSWEQALEPSVQQCHRAGDQSQPSSITRCHSLQAASTQVPNAVNPELARCSKRCPRLAGASSVAYPAWGEEESKKPPGLRPAKASDELRQLAGLKAGTSCACCLRAMYVLLLLLLHRPP